MPFRFYYGKTGKVWNVTKRAIGVELFKIIGNRMCAKKLHVRIKHIRHSKCRQELKYRMEKNEIQKQLFRIGKKSTEKKIDWVCLKRQPIGPNKGYLLKKRHCN